MIWILAAFAIGIIVLMTDRQFFLSFSFPIYFVMVLLLVGVLFFGREIAGSKSWFAIGGIRLQPAEFAKFATCMAIAKYLSLLNIKIRDLKTKVLSIIFISVPMLLIFLQGDAGSGLVYLSFIFLLYREGLSGNFLLAGLYAVLLFIVTLVLQDTFINLPFGVTITGKTVLIIILFLVGFLVLVPFWRNRLTRRGGKVFKDIILIASTIMVFSIGFIKGNGSTNVVPDNVKMMGTLRAMDENWRENAHDKMLNVAGELAKKYHAEIDFEIRKGYPFLENDIPLTEKAIELAKKYLGEENVTLLPIRMTAEDFSYYTKEVPSCFYRLGTANKENGIIHGLHTSSFDIDENSLEIGMGLMAFLATSESS